MSSIAINVLLDPDAVTVEKAQAVNSRLRDNYPDGFALDAHHARHITILQCFVKLADLDKVAHAVTAVLRTAEPMNWQSKATSFYDLAHENLMPFQAAFAIAELKRRILIDPELAADPMVQAAWQVSWKCSSKAITSVA